MTTSTRLTTDIRDRLTNDILRHRFTADVDALIAVQVEFAEKVYNDLFDQTTIARMQALPDGWLPRSHDIGVQFGYTGGPHTFVRLWFGGYVRNKMNELRTKPDDTSRVTKLVTDSKSRGCAKVYDPSHKLAIEFERIRRRTRELKDAIMTAEKSIETALNAVTTTKRLVETWPEVEQFARKYETGPAQLPALPTDHLNQLLRLP
jgi:hypothetical protein